MSESDVSQRLRDSGALMLRVAELQMLRVTDAQGDRVTKYAAGLSIFRYMPTTRLKRIKRTKQIRTASIIVIIFGFVLLGWMAFSKLSTFFSRIQTPTKTTSTPAPAKQVYQFLIMGYGGGTHDGTYLTDTLIVARIDKRAKKVTLISIPRDLWVPVPSTVENLHSKINALYQMGLFPKEYPRIPLLAQQSNPASFLIKTVSHVTGLPLDGFIAVDFAAFERVIDVLGGVDIVVKRTFTDYQYPIEGKETDPCDKKDTALEDALKVATESPELAFPCRYENLHFEKGPTKMDGKTALKFARSRHSLDDGGDFNRAARQQLVIEAVKSKILSIGFIPKIIPLMTELEKNIRTDISIEIIKSFLLEAPYAKSYHISTFVIDEKLLKNDFSDYGGFILTPDSGLDNWNGIRTAVHAVISPPPPHRSPTAVKNRPTLAR